MSLPVISLRGGAGWGGACRGHRVGEPVFHRALSGSCLLTCPPHPLVRQQTRSMALGTQAVSVTLLYLLFGTSCYPGSCGLCTCSLECVRTCPIGKVSPIRVGVLATPPPRAGHPDLSTPAAGFSCLTQEAHRVPSDLAFLL